MSTATSTPNALRTASTQSCISAQGSGGRLTQTQHWVPSAEGAPTDVHDAGRMLGGAVSGAGAGGVLTAWLGPGALVGIIGGGIMPGGIICGII